MLEQLIAEQEVTFVDEDLEDAVLNYMDVTRRSSTFDQNLQEINTWNTYIEFLQYQAFQRQRLIDTDCAYAYLNNDGGLFNQGGVCYVQQ
jgi:hypothetical protein